MITTHRAADRPVDRRPAAVLLAVLLTAAVPLVGPLSAQERSREQGTVRGSSPSSPPSGGSSGSSGSSGYSGSSGSKSPGRIAVPRGPEGSSGGSSGGRDRERAGRGHHGGGHHGGGYYGGHYGRGSYGYPWYGSYWGLHYGYPWGWWPWYYGVYDGPSYRGYRGGYYDEAEMGALDLDVSPGRTEVHLDGQFLGTVDAFDGWPQYLWLDKGTYDLVLFLDGYRTVAKQVTVYPGVVLDVGDRLEPGESTRPEDLVTKTHERRDARLEQDREMREKAARDRLGERERMEEWRERARERRGALEDDDRDDREVEEVDTDDEPVLGDRDDRSDRGDDDRSLDARGEPGRVRLDVEPGDASIYLDGRFIGTGDDLAKLHSGLLVDAGEHRLAVVRPGRRSEEREFRVAAGQEVELEIELPAN
jgi:hypothetical protein